MTTPFSPPSLEARIAMINGKFDLPQENLQAINETHQIIERAAKELAGVAARVSTTDQGTMVRVIQKLQAAKDVACQAFIIRHYRPQGNASN